LMRKCRGLEGVAKADFEELLSCPGMDEKSAQSVLHFFKNRNRMDDEMV